MSNPYMYPVSPSVGVRDTSREAAEAIAPSVQTLRDLAFKVLLERDSTADECAEAMGKSILAVRPRISELVAMDMVVDSGKRRRMASGRSGIVWRAVRSESQARLF